jgi:pimeloyl-ACP methyl ester carboxylesterase
LSQIRNRATYGVAVEDVCRVGAMPSPDGRGDGAGRGAWPSPDHPGRDTNRREHVTVINNVVLVHGAFVDGSGWRGVYDRLRDDGFRVVVVQNPTSSLDADVAATRRVLDRLDGPAVLVGHSYGGVVITEAGRHDHVAALVYVAAFAPAEGESVSALISDPPPGAPEPPILPPQDGALLLDPLRFAEAFAADLPTDDAAFMADSQTPWGLEALAATVGDPAWRTKPSWWLLAGEDRTIPPAAQRAMAERAGATVVEVQASHAAYISQPAATADLIATAATQALEPRG